MFRLPFGSGEFYNGRESVEEEIIMRDKKYAIDFVRLELFKRLHIRQKIDLLEKGIKMRIL